MESTLLTQKNRPDSFKNRRTVVFSMGDPNGIGPEVLLKALSQLINQFKAIVFGSSQYLQSLSDQMELSIDFDRLQVVETGTHPFPPDWGKISRDSGKLAYESLKGAVSFCLRESFPLLVTAPVCKESLRLAGFRHPGQTEFLGEACGCPDQASMAFLSEKLKILLVTVHIPLKSVANQLTVEKIVFKGKQFCSTLGNLGLTHPKIAVCGLNPHASESGLFGDEEQRIIQPAVDQLNADCEERVFSGPLPPDTVFYRANRGDFDAVVALYHDQGLIPLKLVGFEQAVNTTLGLPLVRTSPDHGTGFEIAGTGQADASSMIAAVEWGWKLVNKGRLPT